MKKLLFALATLLATGSALAAQNYCGDLRTSFGPFDYRKRATLPSELDIVERVHFPPEVEAGIKGATGAVGADLSYTLVVWPNHYRALVAMSTIALRTKSVQLYAAKYPVDCWFNRAIRFAPDDGAVHAIYANHLFAQGKAEAAFAELKQAVALEPENPVINYNIGLAYLKTKDYDNALKYAQKAYSLDYPLPGLKKKLIEADKWVEPTKQKTAAGVGPVGEPAEEKTDGSGTAGKPTE